MSSPSPEEERELARLRELTEIESLLGMVEATQTETDEYLTEVLRKFDELSW
jgi:hypothetical protein